MKKLLAAVLLALLLVAPGFAQTPAPNDQNTDSTAQRRQQGAQRLGRLLDAAHEHPGQIDDLLSKVGQQLIDKRGMDPKVVDSKLQAIYPVLQQAGKMDDATYQAQKRQLMMQIVQALRPPRHD